MKIITTLKSTQVDFKKLAPLVGMGNPGSAKNAWAKIKKKLAAGTNDFTVRELQIMACAWRCKSLRIQDLQRSPGPSLGLCQVLLCVDSILFRHR